MTDIHEYIQYVRSLRDNTAKSAVKVVFYDKDNEPTLTAELNEPSRHRNPFEDTKRAALESLNVDISYTQVEIDEEINNFAHQVVEHILDKHHKEP